MLQTKFIIFIFIELSISYIIEAGTVLTKCLSNEDYESDKIWSEFMAPDVNSDDMVEYQIRNIPRERFPDALHVMEQFLEDEPQNKALGMFLKLFFLYKIEKF